MKKVIAIVLLVVLLVSCGCTLSGCKKTDATDWEYIKQKGYITVGYDNAFPPMGFVDESGKDVGFDLDLAKAVGDYLKIDVKLQPINWATKEGELQGKNIDLIWNGYTITPKRQEQVSFSVPYLKNEQVLVIRKEDATKYTSIQSLAGKQIIAQSGSTAVDVIKEEATLKNCPLTELADNVMIMNELVLKYGEGAVMDYVVANYILAKNAEYGEKLIVVKNVSLEYEEYGIGIRKEDTETVKKINEALNALNKNGELKKLADKWGLTELLLVK